MNEELHHIYYTAQYNAAGKLLTFVAVTVSLMAYTVGCRWTWQSLIVEILYYASSLEFADPDPIRSNVNQSNQCYGPAFYNLHESITFNVENCDFERLHFCCSKLSVYTSAPEVFVGSCAKVSRLVRTLAWLAPTAEN